MEFPKIKDIATKKVVTVNDTDSIGLAVKKMYSSNHRDVIICSETNPRFGILKVNDLIKMKLEDIDFSTPIGEIKYDTVASIGEEDSVVRSMELIDKKSNCLCVVDKERNLKGYISYYDVIATIDPKMLLQKRTIGDLMIKTMLKYASQEEKTLSVISLIDEGIDDCVILTDERGEATGILTTKDVVKLFGEERDLTLPVKTYMSTPVQSVGVDIPISEALEFIQERRFKRLIVRDSRGTIAGQITQEELIAKVYSRWADILKDSANELSEVNRVLHERANKYKVMAATDSLTNLPNRSRFEESLHAEMDKVRRYGIDSFSLILFDVDDFKHINDTKGHLIGDQVLRVLARSVEQNLRSSDLIARWGGEEFVVLLPCTSAENARITAENIRSRIEVLEITADLSGVTCSFGVTGYRPEEGVQELLKRADEAMYEAKFSGKNRVVLT